MHCLGTLCKGFATWYQKNSYQRQTGAMTAIDRSTYEWDPPPRARASVDRRWVCRSRKLRSSYGTWARTAPGWPRSKWWCCLFASRAEPRPHQPSAAESFWAVEARSDKFDQMGEQQERLLTRFSEKIYDSKFH